MKGWIENVRCLMDDIRASRHQFTRFISGFYIFSELTFPNP
jgi:hypothetical protein